MGNNSYKILVHVDDVALIWMRVHIEIFLPLFCQFSEIDVLSKIVERS